MKKRAKFVVEVEYDEDDAPLLDTNKIKVLRMEQEGDYAGLTAALTAAMLFAKFKGDTPQEVFRKKLRILRAVASTLVNGLSTLRSHGAFDDKQMDVKELAMVADLIKHTTNVITYGIAIMLGVNDKQVEECNKEFEDHAAAQDEKLKNDEGKRSERPSEEDFL
jgi:hypothetical protein